MFPPEESGRSHMLPASNLCLLSITVIYEASRLVIFRHDEEMYPDLLCSLTIEPGGSLTSRRKRNPAVDSRSDTSHIKSLKKILKNMLSRVFKLRPLCLTDAWSLIAPRAHYVTEKLLSLKPKSTDSHKPPGSPGAAYPLLLSDPFKCSHSSHQTTQQTRMQTHTRPFNEHPSSL